MKNILLIRHAKSSKKDELYDDFERPLSGRGKEECKITGFIIRENLLPPGVFITSPARRARKTAKKIAKEIGFDPVSLIMDMRIYDSGLDGLLKIISEIPDSYPVIYMCGHNPGLSELRSFLTGSEYSDMETGSCSLIELDIKSWKDKLKGNGYIRFTDSPGKYIDKDQ